MKLRIITYIHPINLFNNSWLNIINKTLNSENLI